MIEPQHLDRGDPTANPLNLAYRMTKLQRAGVLRGIFLDCGCADGGYAVTVAAAGASCVVGVDPEADRLQAALLRKRCDAPVWYARAVSEALPLLDESFDTVLMNEVLEHVDSERAALAEVRRVLRPGGYFVVMGPNRWFPFEGHGARIGRIKIHTPVPFVPWLPAPIGRRFMRARNYWPRELIAVIETAGFHILHTEFVFPLFEKHRWLPEPLAKLYRSGVPHFERLPALRRFGVSTFILARKPG